MRVLVVNDDGIDSDGIVVLSEALTVLGDVTVVAPDGDRSGQSHSISSRHYVRVVERRDRGVKSFACSGTPADCVVLGIHELCGGRPDLVVSGINRGANAGDDINYSGTVAAAVEARIAGIPSIAVSLSIESTELSADEEDSDAMLAGPPTCYWDTAALVTVEVASAIIPLTPNGTYWNVNVPNVVYESLPGVRVTRQARKSYKDRITRGHDEERSTFYHVWATPHMPDIAPDTDLGALKDGFASCTPLLIDRTDRASFERHRALIER